jgi:hypothetical protein
MILDTTLFQRASELVLLLAVGLAFFVSLL